MTYSTPLSETAIVGLAEYTIGRVCEAAGPSVQPTDLKEVPPEAVQATLELRVADIEDIDQARYDRLFDNVQGEANARINPE